MPSHRGRIRPSGAVTLLMGLALWAGVTLSPDAAEPKAGGKPDPGPAPQFSPSGGVFSDGLRVRLSAGDASLLVRFTLDGSEPTEHADAFDKELRLSASTLVKARVFRGAAPAGPTASQTYIVLEKDLTKFSSHLPVILINTFGKEILHQEKVMASVRVLARPPGGVEAGLVDHAADFDGRGEMRLRGNSSLRYLKRSYALKTRDDAGESRSAPLLGLPADSDWVLYAPYPDKTLLRDVLAYDLSRQLGRYATRTRFVEVFVNQIGGKLSMRHYAGVFVLEEKIKRGADRVKLQKLGPNDSAPPNVTGGYIFKKDHSDTYGEVMPSVEGRPMGFGGGGSRNYMSGPGGFPGDPNGFLPSQGGGRRDGGVRMGPQAGPPGVDNASLLERLRTLVGPNEDPPPPPQPGVQAPRRATQEGQPGPLGQLQLPNDAILREGGFSFRTGNSDVEESFRTSQRTEFYYVEPKAEDITPAQKAWLKNHLNEFERALFGADFKNPVKGYAAYIDVDSFIDHHLLVEVTKNIDGFRFSTFYQKDRGGKIRLEPIWDWNLSFGNANGKQGWMPEYWYWPQLDDTQYSWFRRLFEDPDFGQRYVDRWGQLQRTVFSLTNIYSRVDALVADLGQARVRNFQRWPILGRKIWPNTFVGRTYEEEIEYLKDFTKKRLAWIEDQFVAAPKPTGGKPDDASVPVGLSAPVGRIYYTLDGTDPRAAGGGVASAARPYSEPMRVPAGSQLVARALVENRWSPPVRL